MGKVGLLASDIVMESPEQLLHAQPFILPDQENWAGIKSYHSVLPFLAYRARIKAGSKKGHGHIGASQDSLRSG